MRVLLQRVSKASVAIAGEVVSSIGPGLALLVGIGREDDADAADYLAAKTAHLRIFEDEARKMNLSLLDIRGEALVISQFTLYADTVSSGRRPSFSPAAPPEEAEALYLHFVEALRKLGVPCATGRFGADMQCAFHNDGPVTIMLEYPR